MPQEPREYYLDPNGVRVGWKNYGQYKIEGKPVYLRKQKNKLLNDGYTITARAENRDIEAEDFVKKIEMSADWEKMSKKDFWQKYGLE